ncbi:60S ribosomal export protein NMD3 [Halorhabdus rudnickae]|uniref:60S ribosomal export protein NMD3 n=1 Tax=Halorhabdus rudnickae TaxID=1775544 RepID=UPI0010831F23|nr:60S ribosomal export protein NMD3 [Halorhabdus rudnickae]
MTRSGAFCPRCGDPIESDPGERPAHPEARDPDSVLCDACYFEEFALVDAPDRIEVRVCSQCGAVHRGNRWVDVGAEDYTDVAVDVTSEALGVHVDATDVAWQVAPEQVDRNTIRMHATFSGVVRGTPLTEEVVVPVKIARETCQRCGRIAGGSFASTVQIRAVDRTPTDEEEERAEAIAREIVAEMEATGDRDAFVTDVGSVDGGLNIKVSTTKIGQKIAQRLVAEFGGSFSDSERLITEDEDGEKVYRVTYAVRLPPFSPGEVIDPEDDEGPVLVRSVQGNLKGTRLSTGAAYEASFEDGDAPEARRLGDREDGVETTLVAIEDDHAVQVLDPETYETKSIPRPDYLDTEAEVVPVLKSRAGLHVLPGDDGDEGDDA